MACFVKFHADTLSDPDLELKEVLFLHTENTAGGVEVSCFFQFSWDRSTMNQVLAS